MEDFSILFKDIRHEGENDLRKAQLVMLRILKIVDYICTKNKLTYWLTSGTLLGALRHGGFIPWDDDLDIAMPREDYEKFINLAVKELPKDLFLQTFDTDPNYDSYGLPCKVRDEFSLYMEERNISKSYRKGIFIDVFPIDKFRKSFPGRFIDYSSKWLFTQICKYNMLKFQEGKGLKVRAMNFIAFCNRFPKPNFWIKTYQNLLREKIKNSININDNYVLGFGYNMNWIRFYEPKDIYPLRKVKFEDSFFWMPNNPEIVLRKSYGDDFMVLPAVSQRKAHALNIIIDSRIEINSYDKTTRK